MIENIKESLVKCIKAPEKYLNIQNQVGEELKIVLKDLYKYSVSNTSIDSKNIPEELYIDDMDDEQIWQQLELNNEYLVEISIKSTSKVLLKSQNGLKLNYFKKKYETNDESEEDEESIEEKEVEHNTYNNAPSIKTSHRSSVVDDQFFKLSEMEKFLEKEEKRENKMEQSDDESIDYFEDEDENEDPEVEREVNLKYNEYFDSEEMKDNREHYDEDQQENQVDDESTFEKRQKMLQNTIQRLEKKALDDKSWQLKGEINATTRPENALLEEYLEFDSATKAAPIITEKTTMHLEEIIFQRIKNRAFDNVERKNKAQVNPTEFRKTIVLDQEKSKESLAQIYEKEYANVIGKLNPDKDEEKEPEEHKKIRNMLKQLFNKLNTLSNYHVTPKAIVPEPKIITNTPAVTMEEVAPISISNATLLAPEEIKNKPHGEVANKAELTKTDKNRIKRQNKAKRKEKAKLLKLKENSGTSKQMLHQNKIKQKDLKKLQSEKPETGERIKSSKSFFQALQDGNQTKLVSNKKAKKTNVNKVKSPKSFKL